jgi:hypothetical protein
MPTPNTPATPSPQDHECGICTEPFNEQRPPFPLDTCRHVFCQSCIERWMTTDNANRDKCPECRTPIGSQFEDAQDNVDHTPRAEHSNNGAYFQDYVPHQVQHGYFNRDALVGQFDYGMYNQPTPARHHHHGSSSRHHNSSRRRHSDHHRSSRHHRDYDDWSDSDSESDSDPFSTGIRDAFAQIDSFRRHIDNDGYYVVREPERRGMLNRIRDTLSRRSSREIGRSIAVGGFSAGTVVTRRGGTVMTVRYSRR